VQVTDAGSFNTAVFASDDTDKILALRSSIFDCMEACVQSYLKKERKKHQKKDDKSTSSHKSKSRMKKNSMDSGEQDMFSFKSCLYFSKSLVNSIFSLTVTEEGAELDNYSIYSGDASVISDMSAIV